MSAIAESQDLVPMIFNFLPPSSYVSCSLVSTLWEVSSRKHIYRHITALHGLTFSKAIVLFTGNRNLSQYVESCCFYYSIPASRYIDANVSIFIQYILSTCHNLIALTFWDLPLDGDAFALLNRHSQIRVLTFQNCTWDYSALQSLISSCSNTQLLQIYNASLFDDERAYHRANISKWVSRWKSATNHDTALHPTSIVIQSARHELSAMFWQLLHAIVDTSTLVHLKLFPHINDMDAAQTFLSSCLPHISCLETLIVHKSTAAVSKNLVKFS